VGAAVRWVKTSEVVHEHVAPNCVDTWVAWRGAPEEIMRLVIRGMIPCLLVRIPAKIVKWHLIGLRRHQLLSKLVVVNIVVNVMADEELLLCIRRKLLLPLLLILILLGQQRHYCICQITRHYRIQVCILSHLKSALIESHRLLARVLGKGSSKERLHSII
jgi:hypothetical protein